MTGPRLTVGQLFEAQVRRTPGRIAVSDGQRTLTYQELNRRANRWAAELHGRGVGREQRVGLLADRTLEAVVACLAVVKAGAAFVPLEPAHPVDRLRSVLRDCAPALVLTDPAALSVAGSLDVPTVLVSDTYFTEDQLAHLLDRPELGDLSGVRVFRSHQHGLDKASGLFDIVPHRMEVPSRGVIEQELLRRIAGGVYTAEEMLLMLGELGID